ncbi:unnamed protein product, partial [Rotaria sp. Silwood2]
MLEPPCSSFVFLILWINEVGKVRLDLISSQFSDSNINSNKRKCKTKRHYFITDQSSSPIKINSDSLVLLTALISEAQ